MDGADAARIAHHVKAALAPPSHACEETYGLFPCSTSLPGSIFLVFVYGMLLLKGANLISDGSEMLLAIMDPGLIGGLLLPILGALPDSAMIVMSGLGGSQAKARKNVAVGIGTLAGSSVMLLSIAWGGSLWVGRCDIEKGVAVNKRLTRPYDFMTTGVTTDSATMINSHIMILSAFLYLFPQVPTFMGYPHDPSAAFWGGVACLVSLAAYCAFQVVYPELQKRQKEAAHGRMMKSVAMKAASQMAKAAGTVLIGDDGMVREEALRSLFVRFDEDKSGFIDRDEVRKMMKMVLLASKPGEDLEASVEWMMNEMDKDQSGEISFEELRGGMHRWFDELKRDKGFEKNIKRGGSTFNEQSPLMDMELGGQDQGNDDDDDDDDDDDEEDEAQNLTKGQILQKAGMLLIGGTALVALFSDPMVDAVASFSTATHIPPFFVSFLVTPFASNASELVSSLQFAKKKKIKNISLTYSQVYGAITMNNTMCLGLFLLVVWYRKLDWTFSSEVVTTMSSILALGFFTSSRATFPTYMVFASLAIYPAALALVYFLDYVVGWQ